MKVQQSTAAATEVGPPKRPAFLVDARLPALAVAAVALASLANFLRFQQYPMLSGEVGMVLLFLLVFALAAGSVYAALGRIGRAIFEALLLFLAVDLNGDSLLAPIAASLAALVFVLAARRSILSFLAVMAFAALLAGFAGAGQRGQAMVRFTQPAVPPNSSQPAILHLILDEHAGVEALRAEDPDGAKLRKTLRSFYEERGFRLFGKAYSQHLHTVNAIPHVLNFGASPPPGPAQRKEGVVIRRNAWFDTLRQRGYRIHVYQSDYVDYCSGGAESVCTEYDAVSLARIAGAPISRWDKAGLLITRFAFLSRALKEIARQYELLRDEGMPLPDAGYKVGGRTSSVNALATFDLLIRDLGAAKRGEAYFAHLLIPHYPYTFDAQCRMKDVDDWLARRSIAPLAERERAYYEQIGCTHAKLDQALRALAASPGGKDAVIIVHGDHGSRITLRDPTAHARGAPSDEDMVAGFATLFAVRAPGIGAGYEERAVPAATLLGGLARSDLRSIPAPGEAAAHEVMLDDRSWIPRKKAKLPAAW